MQIAFGLKSAGYVRWIEALELFASSNAISACTGPGSETSQFAYRELSTTTS